jgi:hypothetical protein
MPSIAFISTRTNEKQFLACLALANALLVALTLAGCTTPVARPCVNLS